MCGGGLAYGKPCVYLISSAGDYLGLKRYRNWMSPPSGIAKDLQALSAFTPSFPCDADWPGHHGELHQRDFTRFETGSVSYSLCGYCGYIPRWLGNDLVHEC